MFGLYNPNYLILPRRYRSHRPNYNKIWIAVMRHDINMLRAWANNLPLNLVTDAHHNTLIHVSAMFGNVPALAYILSRQDHPDIDAPNIFGTTALHVALEHIQGERYTIDHKEVAVMLMQNGADPRVLNSLGHSGLVAASGNTCPRMIYKIYQKLCQLENDKYEMARMLLHSGWSLRQFFWTKDLTLIRQMLEYDAGALIYDDTFDSTPMHDALRAHSSIELFKLLLEFGASVTEPTLDRMDTPLHVACLLSDSWDNLDVVTLLLDYGADPNAPNFRDNTCFHTALAFGTHEVAMLLLDRGADVYARDVSGNTSMHFAAFNGNVEMIKLLQQIGLSIEEKNWIDSVPLHMSSRTGRAAATQYLLRKGADVNWKDQRGWAALHYAVQTCTCEGPMHECMDTVEILVDHGAEIDVEKPEEKSALALCIDSKNPSFGMFLVRSLAMTEPRDPRARALTLQIIEKSRTAKDYYDNCVKEIQKMKTKMLYGKVSFYRALTCNKKEFRALFRNPLYVRAMNDLIRCHYISDHFAIYRHRLISRYLSAMAIQGPINDATEALSRLTGIPDVTNAILTNIVNFLGKYELKVLGKCKQLIDDSEYQMQQDY